MSIVTIKIHLTGCFSFSIPLVVMGRSSVPSGLSKSKNVVISIGISTFHVCFLRKIHAEWLGIGERRGEARQGWGGVWLSQVISVAKLDSLLEGGLGEGILGPSRSGVTRLLFKLFLITKV